MEGRNEYGFLFFFFSFFLKPKQEQDCSCHKLTKYFFYSTKAFKILGTLVRTSVYVGTFTLVEGVCVCVQVSCEPCQPLPRGSTSEESGESELFNPWSGMT